MNQLKAGAVLNYAIIILNMFVGLLYTPYMLRMMGQSEYGLYSLVASFISYLTVLDLGMGDAIVRYTAKFRAEGKTTEQYEMFGMFLVLYTIIGIIALIIGLGLYLNIDTLFSATMTVEELDKARIMIILLIFNLAVTFPLSIFGSIITAYERFVFPKAVNFSRVIFNTIIMICLLEMGYKAVAMVILQTVLNVLTLVFNVFYCKYKLQIKIFFCNFRWGFLKEVAVYSFWIFLNVIMDRIYWSSGQFILGSFVGTVAVASFAVSVQLVFLYMQLSTAISGVFLPRVTGMVARDDNREEISTLFIRTGRIQFFIISLLLSGFIIFGRDFIGLWAGVGYESVYVVTSLFLISLAIPLMQNLGITILKARNQMKFRSLLYIAIAATSLIFQVLLAKQYGGLGCAISIAGALFLGQGLLMNIYYHKKQGIDILAFWTEIVKMSIVPVILSSVAWFLLRNTTLDSWFSLGIAITMFVVVYIPLFFQFSMNQAERDLFIKPIKRVLHKIRR